MDALDLTKKPPRSPWVKIGGAYMLARTIDKLRAKLPGGNIGLYRIAPGFSERLLAALGCSEEELSDAVARAKSEDEVVAWASARADKARLEKFNDAVSQRRIADVDDVAAFKGRYPIIAEKGFPDDTILFDLLDKDDAMLHSHA
ncbi:MAG: DUF5069 domain-containing protein [Vulcanimicrobiaceae bacterium]